MYFFACFMACLLNREAICEMTMTAAMQWNSPQLLLTTCYVPVDLRVGGLVQDAEGRDFGRGVEHGIQSSHQEPCTTPQPQTQTQPDYIKLMLNKRRGATKPQTICSSIAILTIMFS